MGVWGHGGGGRAVGGRDHGGGLRHACRRGLGRDGVAEGLGVGQLGLRVGEFGDEREEQHLLLARGLDGAVLQHVDEEGQVAAPGFHGDQVQVPHDLVAGVDGDDAPAAPGVEVLE